MAPLIKIALTLLAVGILSALVAPPIYWVVHEGVAQLFPWFKDVPFHRVFSRVLLVCVLLAIGPLLVALRISSFRELGLKKNPYWKADFLWGLLIALVTLTALTMAYVAWNVCAIQENSIELTSLLRIAGAAIAVSLLEEVLFRGLLYGLSRRVAGAFVSALWTSAVFAGVHLISSNSSTQPLDAWSGFREFGRFFSGAPPFPLWVFAFVTLLLMGLLLCWLVERTHSLALPIGLHMGWVFAIQMMNIFTQFQINPPLGMPWVAPNVVLGMVPVGIFAILAICVTFLLCWKYLRGRPNQTFPKKCA